ncbi:MAG: DUF6498-containing protein [Planctomycetota bacterium]|jgi:hypothetical protein
MPATSTAEASAAEAETEQLDPVDVALFGGTLVAAWVLDWQTRDLVWSLWLSSLLVGYAFIVISIVRAFILTPDTVNTDEKDEMEGATDLSAQVHGSSAPLRIFFALFMLGFFTLHFGGFHAGHAVFLNIFFPLSGEPGGLGHQSGGFDPSALLGYWPLVVASVISWRHRLISETHVFNPLTPYKSVIRMHILIFVFAFAQMLGIENFLLYAVVLAFYFVPASWVINLLQGRLGPRKKRD